MVHGIVRKVSLFCPSDKVPLFGTAVSCANLDEILLFLEREFLRTKGKRAFIHTLGFQGAADLCGRGKGEGDHWADEEQLLVSAQLFVWAASLFGRSVPDRVTGQELVLALCDLAQEKGYFCYFLGDEWYVVEGAVARLRELFPRLHLAGFNYLNQNQADIITLVNSAHPDIVFVGSERATQKDWAIRILGHLSCSIVAAVGDNFDSLAIRWADKTPWQIRLLTVIDCLWDLVSQPRRSVMGPLTRSQRILKVLLREFWMLRRRPHLP